MGMVAGARLSTNGIVCLLDAANPKSTIRKKNDTNILVDSATWTTGTGGSTGYNANGSASEQLRAIVDDDPWGGRSVIWRTVPDAVSGADGGWNTSSYSIDKNSLYRASVWVRRHTAGTGGTFYFGVRASPDPIRNDNDATQSNPYFYCPAQSLHTQNQWYLVVGHIFPHTYTGGVRHPQSGYYENGEQIAPKGYCNIGTEDQRWDPAGTTAYFSVYHYYTTNTASGLEFAAPRLDKCDGTEPTIQELYTIGTGMWFDSSLNGNHGKFQTPNLVTWSSDNGGVFNLTGADGSYITVNSFNYATSDSTVLVASRYSGSPRGRILSGNANNWLLGHHGDSAEDHYGEGWIRQAGTSNDQTWGIHVATRNHGSDLASYWKNGVKIVTNSNAGSQGPNGFSIGRWYGSNTEYSQCQVGYVAVWNRVLSDSEITAATNALRGRFGIT